MPSWIFPCRDNPRLIANWLFFFTNSLVPSLDPRARENLSPAYPAFPFPLRSVENDLENAFVWRMILFRLLEDLLL